MLIRSEKFSGDRSRLNGQGIYYIQRIFGIAYIKVITVLLQFGTKKCIKRLRERLKRLPERLK